MPFNIGVIARTSAKHGRGLFATARIPKGTPIWRFTAAADTPLSQTGEMVNVVCKSPSQPASCARSLSDLP